MNCAISNETIKRKLRTWNAVLFGWALAATVAVLVGCGEGNQPALSDESERDIQTTECELDLQKCLLECNAQCSICYDSYDACLE